MAAAHEDTAARIRSAVAQGRAKPLSNILAAVRSRYPGRVVGIRLADSPGPLQYSIRILSQENGLIDVQVDSRTARIVGVKG